MDEIIIRIYANKDDIDEMIEIASHLDDNHEFRLFIESIKDKFNKRKENADDDASFSCIMDIECSKETHEYAKKDIKDIDSVLYDSIIESYEKNLIESMEGKSIRVFLDEGDKNKLEELIKAIDNEDIFRIFANDVIRDYNRKESEREDRTISFTMCVKKNLPDEVYNIIKESQRIREIEAVENIIKEYEKSP